MSKPAERARTALSQGRAAILSRRLIDDLESPVSAYLKTGLGRPYAFLFESVEGGAWRGRYSILTGRPDRVWRCRGDQAEMASGFAAVAEGDFRPEPLPALESLRTLVATSRIDRDPDLPPMAAGLFGVFGYDLARLIEPLGPAAPDPLDLPDAVLTRPSVVAIFDGVAQEIILATPVRPDEAPPEVALAAAEARLDAYQAELAQPLPASQPRTRGRSPLDFQAQVTPQRFREMVERCRDYIAAGDAFQIVPSQRFSAEGAPDPFAFYRSLRRTNPSPFLFHLDFGGFQLSGSSPEILVRLRNGEVTIRPLAGTRPRGATPAEDAALEAELLADPKERAEHLMLVDLGRNDVGRVAEPGSVKVTNSFFVERYSHVMHIVSNVVGQARTELDPVDLLGAALPAGTLSGAPKFRAMQIIDELEPIKRGLAYAGAAGYIASGGEVDVCIVLRTALFKDGQMHVQAGAGVVADSDPEAEYQETLHKSAALKRAAEEAWRFS